MASFLIVDEDRNFREALAIALRLEGHEAAAAARHPHAGALPKPVQPTHLVACAAREAPRAAGSTGG